MATDSLKLSQQRKDMDLGSLLTSRPRGFLPFVPRESLYPAGRLRRLTLRQWIVFPFTRVQPLSVISMATTKTMLLCRKRFLAGTQPKSLLGTGMELRLLAGRK